MKHLFILLFLTGVFLSCQKNKDEMTLPRNAMEVGIHDIKEYTSDSVEFVIAIRNFEPDQIGSLVVNITNSFDLTTTQYVIPKTDTDTVYYIVRDLPCFRSFSALVVLQYKQGMSVASPKTNFNTSLPATDVVWPDVDGNIISDLGAITIKGKELLCERFGFAILTRPSGSSPEVFIPLNEFEIKSDTIVSLSIPQWSTASSTSYFFQDRIQACKLYVYNLDKTSERFELADLDYRYIAYPQDTKVQRGELGRLFIEHGSAEFVGQFVLYLDDVVCPVERVESLAKIIDSKAFYANRLYYRVPLGIKAGRYTMRLERSQEPNCSYFGGLDKVTVL